MIKRKQISYNDGSMRLYEVTEYASKGEAIRMRFMDLYE